MDLWQFALVFLAASVLGPCCLVLLGFLLRRSGLSTLGGVATPSVPVPAAGPPSVHLDQAELAELRGELSAVRAEWKAHQKQLDAYLDAFEDLEESVERRRRRAASSRSKAEAAQAEEEPAAPNDREAARRRARALGYRV